MITFYPAPILHRRNLQQFESWETSHDKTNSLGYNASTPESTLFRATPQCILTPDNANGPSYILGESIRSNVVESQVGVPLHLEMQFINITTCLPATNLFIDIWSCNTLGVYSGVSAASEGGLGSTFLRGFLQTDNDGVVVFDTIFPGHYSGRASHAHVIAHSDATLNANGTYSGWHISQLSQLFWDQDLITKIEATSPYNTNTIPKTSNNADLFTGYSASASYNLFPEYIFVGGTSDLSKGLMAWIEIGIRASADYTNYGTNVAYRDAFGGHGNPGFNEGIVDIGPVGTPGGATNPTTPVSTVSKPTISSAVRTVTRTGAGTVAHWGQ